MVVVSGEWPKYCKKKRKETDRSLGFILGAWSEESMAWDWKNLIFVFK